MTWYLKLMTEIILLILINKSEYQLHANESFRSHFPVMNIKKSFFCVCVWKKMRKESWLTYFWHYFLFKILKENNFKLYRWYKVFIKVNCPKTKNIKHLFTRWIFMNEFIPQKRKSNINILTFTTKDVTKTSIHLSG